MAADLRTEELTAIIREVRERVRARYAGTDSEAALALPDLMPVLHARDAALGKVAAIGSVNPRPGGPLNAIIQSAKRLIARAMDWHVRDQVEFNRAVVVAVEAVLEALNENNRALLALSAQAGAAQRTAGEAVRAAGDAARDARDASAHWHDWRTGWERKLEEIETRFLRSVAELQSAFQHRATLMESNMRENVRDQKEAFSALLNDLQARFWADMQRAKEEHERLIHSELRVLRLRAAAPETTPLPHGRGPEELPAPIDWLAHAERFRGSEEYVRGKQRFYVPVFSGCRAVLDIGCGRGEFLELIREAGVPARGIDLSAESVALCRSKGLEAEVADLFEYLAALPDASLDGIFSAQVVEHIPPQRLPDMIRLAAAKLAAGGRIAIETPNPECLAIFASHFFLDPSHQRPVPFPLLAFYFQEAGFGGIRRERLSPAVESMPSLASLPADFREAFFGGLDYAIIARKLS